MPDFATAFSGKASDRKLTPSEVIRGIRLSIADEYEAIQVYTQLAESIDNEMARAVLLDIANEERVHAGEFLRLLKLLAPDEEGFYQEGAAEVDELLADLKSKGGTTAPAGEESTIGSLKK